MLGPAAPVASGRSATIRASLRTRPARIVRTRWDWDDGEQEIADHAWSVVVHARRAHRYADPGVYRVHVLARVDDTPAADDGVRYITVRRRGQFAASGWIRDASRRVPFGFLITPATATEDAIVLRCLIAGDELIAHRLTWLFAGDPRSLHFGGKAAFRGQAEDHPYRVDVLAGLAPAGRIGQHVTISVYAPGSVPGRDSPLHRISGPVSPGLIDLGRGSAATRGHAPRATRETSGRQASD